MQSEAFKAAVAAHRKGDLATAERLYRAFLGTDADPAALTNLAAILRSRGELAEAETLYRRSLAIDPDRQSTRVNLGNLLWSSGRLAEAAEMFVAIAEASPAANLNLACVSLAQGQDEEGWRLYDQRAMRLEMLPNAPATFPEWRGEALAGKSLLVRPEQGLGDQILAARYLTGTGAAHVSCYTLDPLAALFRQLPVSVSVLGPADLTIARHDYWTMPLSLPRFAEAAPVPYLTAPPRQIGGKIGVAWRGNAYPDPARSMPPEAARELLAIPGAVSLLPEDTGARDFLETAQIIAGLDLVISIDTSIAHLAGAMAKPVWVLLHSQSYDWRWRTEEPFYPSAKLFRQSSHGDWSGPIEAVHRALAGAL